MIPIFQTNNVALATTLATCGVPFDAHPVTGRSMPFVNYYTAEKLRTYTVPTLVAGQLVQKPRYEDWPIDKAATDAWHRGLPGLIVYCFQKVDPFAAVVKAFDRHAEAIHNADESALGGVGMQTLTVLPAVTPEVAAAICCQFAKNRKALLEGWRTAIPWIHLPGPVTTTRGADGRDYRVGSLKLYTLGASAAVKQQIGVA